MTRTALLTAASLALGVWFAAVAAAALATSLALFAAGNHTGAASAALAVSAVNVAGVLPVLDGLVARRR